MSGPSWTLPSPDAGVVTAPSSDQASQQALFFGEDIWFDIGASDVNLGEGDYVVTAGGDLTVATGREALRQSLMRRYITNPGEVPTLPDYGAGAAQYVKAKNTAAVRAELAGRIRAQSLRDPRVASVDQSIVEQLDDGSPGIRISVLITPKGQLRTDKPLPVQLEIR